jgi:hypothetical protein
VGRAHRGGERRCGGRRRPGPSAGGRTIAPGDPRRDDPRVLLLRQLTVGLSVHRLYEGNQQLPPVRAAIDRIRSASEVALERGPVEVDIRSGRFVLDGRELVGDPSGRLAQACFERRVEHLRLVRAPDDAELGVWFAALDRDAVEVEADGGLPTLLERAGVTAFVAMEDVPDPTSGEADAQHLLAAGEPSVQEDDNALERALAMRLEDGEDATSLYARLQQAAASLPDDTAARSPFYRHAADLVAGLRPVEQARFGRLVLDMAGTDDDVRTSRASTWRGTTRSRSATSAISPTWGSPTWSSGSRGSRVRTRKPWPMWSRPPAAGIPTWRAWPGARPPAGPTTDRPTPRRRRAHRTGRRRRRKAPRSTPRRRQARRTGTTATATATRTDGHPLRTAFPTDVTDHRQLAMTALVDFLANDPRPDQLRAVGDNLTTRLRVEVAEGDVDGVRQLLDTLTEAAELTDAAPDGPLHDARRHAIDGQLVADVLRETGTLPVDRFRPFGAAAIGALVALLAPQHPPAVRRSVADLLVELAPDHLDALEAELGHRSPPVLAELVGVVARAGGPRTVPMLTRLAHHPSPEVLTRVIAALQARDGTALALIGTIATSTTHVQVQDRCLEALAEHPDPRAVEQLELLARRGSSPLPRKLRRRARALTRRKAG